MYWTNLTIDVLLFFFVIGCLLMCLVVLMQRAKQEGLGAAFGSGLTSDIWGAQTPRVLVNATIWLAVLFFVLSIVLARLYAHRSELERVPSALDRKLDQPGAVVPLPPATPAPAAAKTGLPATAPAPNSAPVPAVPAPVAPAANTPAASLPAKPLSPKPPDKEKAR